MAKFESGSDKGTVLTPSNDDDYETPSIVPKSMQSDNAIGGATLALILGYLGIGANEYRKAKEKALEEQLKQDEKIREDRAKENKAWRKKQEAFDKDLDATIGALDAMKETSREDRRARGFRERLATKKGTILGNTKGR